MNAGTTYDIQVIRTDRATWESELRAAVKAELLDMGIHRSVEVHVSRSLPSPNTPAVGVCFGSTSCSVDGDAAAAVSEAAHEGRLIIPVVDDLRSFSQQVPRNLHSVNAFAWTRGARALARHLLEELGIQDKQRKVFISHRREDGLWAAEQMYDALSHCGFTPFIDRFCIRAGDRVQDKIADVLEDHAFLLLLETPLAHLSPWVFDEVDYALSHAMGVLIVRWPNHPTPVPGSHGLPRIELSGADLTPDASGNEVLTTTALDRLIENVERAHAQGISRRRRMLMQSVQEAALAAGCTECLTLPEWRLRVAHVKGATLIAITPRLPTALDLQKLDQERTSYHSGAGALLVHSARTLRPPLRDHLEWAAGDRDLTIAPENAIGGFW